MKPLKDVEADVPARGAPRDKAAIDVVPEREVKLSTVGTPTPQVSETTVKRAEAPRLLEYSWGGNEPVEKPEFVAWIDPIHRQTPGWPPNAPKG